MLRPLLRPLLLAAVAGSIACGDKEEDDSSRDLLPEGTSPGECSDGADNDADGDYDCNDSDCDGAPDCQEGTGTDGTGGDGTDGTGGDGTDGEGTDSTSGSDADADGVPDSEDCDDGNPDVGVQDVDDPDCDGVPTHAGGGDLLRIRGGAFDMGCTPGQTDCADDESPVMPVTLTYDYYLGITEVTQGQYEAITGVNNSTQDWCGADCPMDNLSWMRAASYANALSAAAGLTACYHCVGSGVDTEGCTMAVEPALCDGYRLPTEAEWENAARCGEDLLYAGSNDPDAVASWEGNSAGGTFQPVAGRDPNACGLYDMSGSVWELVHDIYDSSYYLSVGRTDPRGPNSGPYRAKRGGDKGSDATELRVSARHYVTESSQGSGLRLARTVLAP